MHDILDKSGMRMLFTSYLYCALKRVIGWLCDANFMSTPFGSLLLFIFKYGHPLNANQLEVSFTNKIQTD